MTSTISEAAIALGRLSELSIFGKATVILLIGLASVMLSRRARASVRHLLLAATLAAVLVLPLIVWIGPEVIIGIPASQPIESADIRPADPPVAPALLMIASLPNRATEDAAWSLPSWLTIVRLVWLAGALLLLVRLAVDLRRLYRICRGGRAWLERREIVQSLASESGIRRKVEVLLHEGIPGPLTCGLWRPVILLPDEACEWNEADLHRAIVHELEHVQRRDWAFQLTARVTCILYWYHPLVWVAFRWLSLEAERAADDAVVRSSEHTEYAEQLVLLAGLLSKTQARSALGMANRSHLSRRVSALLDGTQRRGRVGSLVTAGVLSVASLVVFAIAPVRAVTQSGNPTVVISAQEPRSQSGSQGNASKSRVSAALDHALVKAAVEGDLVGIDELLGAGANVNCEIAVGAAPNPLIGAAQKGQLEAVRLLLDRGAIIDQTARGVQNALIQASMKGHLDVVKLLVARGADVNARVWAVILKPETVWVIKSSEGQNVAVKRLRRVANKPGPDDQQRKGEWRTPLSMARKGGHQEVVKFLLSSGALE
jgi:beta-lactamase regulating signal transducer with metallopeptidase domain